MPSALEARGLEEHDLPGAELRRYRHWRSLLRRAPAMLLARSGRRVLAVDRVQSPSESNSRRTVSKDMN